MSGRAGDIPAAPAPAGQWPTRRGLFAALLAALSAGRGRALAGLADPLRLAAAWDDDAGHAIGLLAAQATSLRVAARIDVPTRAHGLLVEPGGTLLAVARRPGDWLLRWRPAAGVEENAAGARRVAARPPQWHWVEPGRAFNGHALIHPDGGTLYTSETDLDSGAGLIGVRDAVTLAKRAEWPSHGRDPHQIAWGPDGGLWVANGGIETLPERGRVKLLQHMDSSLARLDATTGARLGQWRLPDRRLSLRHLAWRGEVLGIALQAEHDSAAERNGAPVLALFDGRSLRTAPVAQPLAGYAGDIAATGAGFALGCPRAGAVALFDEKGGWQRLVASERACALASDGRGGLWAGGRWALRLSEREALRIGLPGLRLDNHWTEL